MVRYQSVVRKYSDKSVKEQYTRAEAKSYMADWDACYTKYHDAALELCNDERVIAAISVRLCYEKYHNRGMKFPWVVAPNGIIDNIKQQENILVPLRTEVGESVYLGKHYTLVPHDYEPSDEIFDELREGLLID